MDSLEPKTDREQTAYEITLKELNKEVARIGHLAERVNNDFSQVCLPVQPSPDGPAEPKIEAELIKSPLRDSLTAITDTLRRHGDAIEETLERKDL